MHIVVTYTQEVDIVLVCIAGSSGDDTYNARLPWGKWAPECQENGPGDGEGRHGSCVVHCGLNLMVVRDELVTSARRAEKLDDFFLPGGGGRGAL